MIRHAIFMQECPICGRPLEIKMEYHGKKVACRHCSGWFMALDKDRAPAKTWKQKNRLLNRADELLELCAAGSHASYY